MNGETTNLVGKTKITVVNERKPPADRSPDTMTNEPKQHRDEMIV